MDTEQLEKQLSVWNRLLYVALGSSITLLFSSFDEFFGIVWFVVQITVTSSGFFLLWGKRWRTLPLSKERTITIFGYLLASWILFLVPSIFYVDDWYYKFLFGYTVFLVFIYWRSQKKLSGSDEMFP
jgi:hypothetical protein